MIYKDRIYGKVKISEPVILDLINSKSLQRLKGVDQAGYFKPYFPNKGYSRFEHSLGVYILLKKYGVSLEEQIAGLIHDVSHSVFSHCIDYVLDSGSHTEQNHQDNIFNEFVRKSDIPAILKNHSFDLDYILDDKNFPLKEKDLPDLCADRIDYSLREIVNYGKSDNIYIDSILDNLIIRDKSWIFKNLESAKKYAESFRIMNNEFWAGNISALMFITVGGYLKHALEEKYISENDLYTTDKEIIDKINIFLDKDERLKLFWDRMNNKISFSFNRKDYDCSVLCKSRIVDPLCIYNGNVLRVSEIDKSWKNIVEKESKPKEYHIKFER